MYAAIAIVELLLVAVLYLSGLTKLTDMKSFHQSLGEFGLKGPLVPFVGYGIVTAEIGAATLILFPQSARMGLMIAFGVLIVFTAAIIFHLLRGSRPRCRCFGQLDDKPITPANLLRNGTLIALAMFALNRETVNGPIGVFGWLTTFETFERFVIVGGAALFVAVLVEAWILMYLLKQYGSVLSTISGGPMAQPASGLPIGSDAPDFSLKDYSGQEVSLSELQSRSLPILLAFSSPDCGYCMDLNVDYSIFQKNNVASYTFVQVTLGDANYLSEIATTFGFPRVLSRGESGILDSYNIKIVPSAVVISPSGHLQSETAVGADEIRDMLRAVSIVDAESSQDVTVSPVDSAVQATA